MAFNVFVDMDITKGIDLTFCPLWPFPDWYINDERASILPHIEVSTSNAKNDSLRYASVQGAYFTINVYFSGVCMEPVTGCNLVPLRRQKRPAASVAYGAQKPTVES